MKNDKLFDMLTEFKVDDEYIEEALTGNSDSRGIKIYAGKTRPMKIIAPIAACLAVVAAAGVLFVNRDKLPISDGNGAGAPASTDESSLTDEEKLDQIMEDFKDRPSFIDIENSIAAENSNTEDTSSSNQINNRDNELWGWDVPSQTEYAEMCKGMVMDMYGELLQGDITWQKGDLNVDYDDHANEIVLCPQINGKSVKGVGVCVFKKYDAKSDPVYVGSFGAEFDTMTLDNFHIAYNADTKTSYYFAGYEDTEKCIVSAQELRFENGTVHDESYLRLVTTYPGDASSDAPYTETAYRRDEEISVDELLFEWLDAHNLEYGELLPIPNPSSDAHLGKPECVQLLIDKYNIPANVNSLHRVIQYIDLNNDGVNEAVIEFRNCEQLRGMYVFSADGKLIGEFDLNGERYGENNAAGNIDTVIQRFSAGIFLCELNGESYYCFETNRTGRMPGVNLWGEGEINRIIVNGDGTLGSRAVVEYCYKSGSQSYKINGEEVSLEEFHEEQHKYAKFTPSFFHPFIW